MATLNSQKNSGAQPSAPSRLFMFNITPGVYVNAGGLAGEAPPAGVTDKLGTSAAPKQTIIHAPFTVNGLGGTQRYFRVDPTTRRIRAFTAVNVEVADGVDLSGHGAMDLAVFTE